MTFRPLSLTSRSPPSFSPTPHPLTLEGLEALQRHPGGTGDKLQQPSSSLLLKGLHRPPEPADHPAVRRAVLQPGVGAPVRNVNLPQAAHYQLGGSGQRAVLANSQTYFIIIVMTTKEIE